MIDRQTVGRVEKIQLPKKRSAHYDITVSVKQLSVENLRIAHIFCFERRAPEQSLYEVNEHRSAQKQCRWGFFNTPICFLNKPRFWWIWMDAQLVVGGDLGVAYRSHVRRVKEERLGRTKAVAPAPSAAPAPANAFQ